MKKKILYFTSHPIQYFSPLFKELDKKTDLKVYYYSNLKGTKDKGFNQKINWDTPLLEGYKFQFLKNYTKNLSMDNRFFDAINPSVVKVLMRSESKIVIVNGWSYFSNWLVFIFGKLFGKEIWLRAESPLNQELKLSKNKLFLKKFFLKHLLFKYFIHKFLYIGSENKKFYEFFGVKNSSRLIYTPYSVDNDFFYSEFNKYQHKIVELKEQLHIPINKKIILFSGKFIPKKNPMHLLEAFKIFNNVNYYLIFMGEGELREKMEEFIKNNTLKNVILTGFINQSEVSKYYAICDVFVMCSGVGETWGLSVNEAMNFEKPVIVSNTCGCSFDLVKYGENGFIYNEGDIKTLSSYLDITLNNDVFRKKAGELSSIIIQDFSIDKIVENIISVN